METDQQRRERYEAAVEQFADSAYRLAYRLTSHHELARELVQETFLAAWKNFSQPSDPESLKPWLFGILRNQYSKLVSRERRHRHVAVDDIATERATNPPIPIHDDVQLALNKLSDEFRLPLLLVAMEGWSTAEAAALLEIPVGTVLSRLHRGRQKLKQLLDQEL